jgi:phospholipid/cholesterol/gamma-HCH transport system substrate-binding protein
LSSFRERNPIVIGIGSIAVLAALLGLAFSLKKLPFVSQNYTLVAEFADAAGLSPDNEVRVAGIKVGRVTGVDLGRDRVLVTMEIKRGVDIPRDATAEISLKTILGTKFVVIDARGKEEPFRDGSRIPLARTTIPFEIYQAANAAVDLLTDVDGAQLNEAFRGLASITTDPNRNLARTVDGAAAVLDTLGAKREALDTLATKGEEILASLDASAPDIQRILQHSNVVLEVLARRRGVVQSLLRNTDRLAAQLGSLLRDKRPELDEILTDLHATLLIVDGSLSQLEEALRILGPTTEAFARIAWRGRWTAVCTYALEGQLLPAPLPLSLNIGTGGLGGPPVDCPTGNILGGEAASASGRSRTRESGIEP